MFCINFDRILPGIIFSFGRLLELRAMDIVTFLSLSGAVRLADFVEILLNTCSKPAFILEIHLWLDSVRFGRISSDFACLRLVASAKSGQLYWVALPL